MSQLCRHTDEGGATLRDHVVGQHQDLTLCGHLRGDNTHIEIKHSANESTFRM